ncbi:DGQHR domain-containing protein [Sphingomonas bacterium]|uniref:DGQHR domain-containing protein n=1 Tax=Sphingomonas bacterium TaxID=1895847 RepID=UPI00157679BA|nr:DGQHR domain-containing protein [Sphingomonas bacterium]
MDIPPDPSMIQIEFDCIRATQPIGDLYVATVPYKKLIMFTHFDVRRVVSAERDVERYLGIQRPVSRSRLADLEKYVNFQDATFPTSVIVAINDQEYVEYFSDTRKLILRNYRKNETSPSIAIRQLGRVIDGQHRIAGLEAFSGQHFDVSTTIFIGADIADQGHIFATVNLEQTKVNRSLVYDLYELAQTRSPQKSAHVVAVTLDRDSESPLYKRIKRLGIATQGRVFEPVSQATFVEGVLSHITSDAKADRDEMLRGVRLQKPTGDDRYKHVLRGLFIDGKDVEIIELFYNYFSAVERKWPTAWNARGQGEVLNRTNGVRALLRFFRTAYLKVAEPGDSVRTDRFFDRVFSGISLTDAQLTVENFGAGTSGEARLYRVLKGQEDL